MNEKQKVEYGTADGFLRLYNAYYGSDYRIVEHGESPDIRCRDAQGHRLNLEITATEDRPGDIQAMLGRSSSRSLEAFEASIGKVVESSNAAQFSSLSGGVSDILAARIQKKLANSYGPNTALVIRDTSGCEWEWDTVVEDVKRRLDLTRRPFEMGIWVLSRTTQRLTRIV